MFSRKNKEDLPRDPNESRNPLPASGQVEEQQPLFTWPYDVDRPDGGAEVPMGSSAVSVSSLGIS